MTLPTSPHTYVHTLTAAGKMALLPEVKGPCWRVFFFFFWFIFSLVKSFRPFQLILFVVCLQLAVSTGYTAPPSVCESACSHGHFQKGFFSPRLKVFYLRYNHEHHPLLKRKMSGEKLTTLLSLLCLNWKENTQDLSDIFWSCFIFPCLSYYMW